MKCSFRYDTIVTELRLKISVLSSWVIACCPAILQSLFEEFEIINRVVTSLMGYFSLSLILYCHLSVYFVTRRHEKQIKFEHVSKQAAADFAKEKKVLKNTRIITLALLIYFLPSRECIIYFCPSIFVVVVTL